MGMVLIIHLYYDSIEIIAPLPVIPYHDNVIKRKHFPRNWPFVRGIHRSPVTPPNSPCSMRNGGIGRTRLCLEYSETNTGRTYICFMLWFSSQKASFAGILRLLVVGHTMNDVHMVTTPLFFSEKNNGYINLSPLDKMAFISLMTFSNAFLWMRSDLFQFGFHWSLFLRSNWQ